MLPTYSFAEIKHIIRSFDVAETEILNGLVQEEMNCYPPYESRAIIKMIKLQKQALTGNEVMFEYLLAYN